MDDSGLLSLASQRSRSQRPRHVLPPGQRVYAVGDLHGRADLTEIMQGLIEAHATLLPVESVTVVWLGDYVDRGPSSREVIDLLIRFTEKPYRSVFLMGNHEDAMLRFLADPAEGPQWCSFGGIETLRSYGIGPSDARDGLTYEEARLALIGALPKPHRDFFLSLKYCEAIGDFFFCHAGVRPGKKLEDQDPMDLIWIRDEFLRWRHDFGKMIVHGHTPVSEPEVLPNRVNVDTAAFATGRLTCAIIEGDTIELLSARR